MQVFQAKTLKGHSTYIFCEDKGEAIPIYDESGNAKPGYSLYIRHGDNEVISQITQDACLEYSSTEKAREAADAGALREMGIDPDSLKSCFTES